MLYPDFDELISLQQQARSVDFAAGIKVTSQIAGSYASKFRGQGMDFEEVREYVHGDDVRNIDWRVTARTGSPHLKIFKEERERSVIVCVDVCSHMRFGTKSTFKSVQAAKVAALLGWGVSHHNDRLGGLIFGDVPDGVKYYRPQRTRSAFFKILKQLCSKEHHHEDVPIEAALADLNRVAPTSSLIFIIADFNFIGDDFEKQLSLLSRRCEVVLVPINDPADSDLKNIGNVIFANDNDGKIQINSNFEAGQKKYHQQWLDNQEKLKNIANKLNIRQIPVNTDDSVQYAVLGGLKSKRKS